VPISVPNVRKLPRAHRFAVALAGPVTNGALTVLTAAPLALRPELLHTRPLLTMLLFSAAALNAWMTLGNLFPYTLRSGLHSDGKQCLEILREGQRR
jgi:Zn-dependent protease